MSTSPPLVVADRYRLVAPLGQGGMGRVWRATDVVLHREVAIKELVPPPGLTPEERQEMRERSLREARAIARLNNINVVRVFDVLRTDADPWIVMEYVPSRSLQDRLATDGPFPPVRAAEIGLGVLNALRAAHRNGVVHRDVKPGNVLIGEDGRVVLTDFGLATVPGDPNVTRTGLVLGSPAYIAPERARDGTAGPAADMWSLGATLYAAVEGASPFARSSAIATLAALATENPPPARNAGPLKPVLNGLLRKDPTHRINAEEAERLLLRAAGRKSKLAFPMSPTMRRPGVGRERPVYQAGPPVIPGIPTAAGSAPVVPGPRPPVTPGRPPVMPGFIPMPGERPPVTPGRTPASGEDRPPVFTPGKATVGRLPQPADTRIDAPAATETPGTAEQPGAPAKGTYTMITPEKAREREEAREAAERAAKEQREAAERQAAERAAAERAAAERAAAERAAAERAAAEREAAERAAAEQKEREAAEQAAREAAQREAAERAAAEQKEREAAEQAEREAEQRQAAERAAAEQQAAERDSEMRRTVAAEAETADRTAEEEPEAAAASPAAGGPLTGTDGDDADEATGETTPAATDQRIEESSVDHHADAAARVTKPAVGARAGAHLSKAARKKGRGRTGTGGVRGRSARGAVSSDTAAAASTPEADMETPQAGTRTPEAETRTPEADTETPEADTKAPEADEEKPATATETDEAPDTGTETEQRGEPNTQPNTEAARDEPATVVPMRTATDEPDTPHGGRTKPKIAAARSGERKVTTATLGARPSPDTVNEPPDSATTVPERRTANTRTLDDPGAGVAGFTASSRPAWQPMPVKPAKYDRGLTVLGTTLTRRQTAIGGAILAVLLLLLALLVPKAVGSKDKQTGRTTGAAPAVSAPATHASTAPSTAAATPSQRPSTTTTTPPSTRPAVALPAGWYLYKDSTGFSVPVPKGWAIQRRGTEVYFSEPGGQYRLLIVDQTNQPKPDPVKDWETQEAARIDSYRNYHRISIHAVSYWDKAADWEYTRTSDNGNLLHVVKRGFITAKDRAYGITWSTSAGDWNANKANLQLIYKGFVPGKS